MVLLHVKRSEKESFLYETPATTDVDVVLRDLVIIHNLRQKVNRLAEEAEKLAAHGPMKPPEQQGLDDETQLLEDYDVTTGTNKARAAPQRIDVVGVDPNDAMEPYARRAAEKAGLAERGHSLRVVSDLTRKV